VDPAPGSIGESWSHRSVNIDVIRFGGKLVSVNSDVTHRRNPRSALALVVAQLPGRVLRMPCSDALEIHRCRS
jgi:hypothetical protein